MNILIIGGTGTLSAGITETAIKYGHEVTLFNRGQRNLFFKNIKTIIGDRDKIHLFAKALKDVNPDVIIDSICFKPKQSLDIIESFNNLKRIIFISSVDVYGGEVGCSPVTEDRIPNPETVYSKEKLECEKVLLKNLSNQITIFRPSHILGKTFLTTSLWGRSPYLVDRILKKKPIPAIDGGRNLMTPIYSGDIAEWVINSITNDKPVGQIFNVCGSEIITQRYYYELIGKFLNQPVSLYYVPSRIFKKHFPSPPQFNYHRPYSNQKIINALNIKPKFNIEMMINETVKYMLENNLVKNSNENTFDDELVSLLEKHENELTELFLKKT